MTGGSGSDGHGLNNGLHYTIDAAAAATIITVVRKSIGHISRQMVVVLDTIAYRSNFMKRTYKLKSLPMVPDPSGDAKKFSYDMNAVRDHAMGVDTAKFLLCPAWIPNFFLALMAVALVSALAYGLLVIGMKVNLDGSIAGTIFILSAVALFFLLWVVLGVPAVIRRMKLDFVMQERGKGSWKVIDEGEWDHFCKMRQLEQDRLKREEEFRKARQQAGDR
jgi:hypothetical protein